MLQRLRKVTSTLSKLTHSEWFIYTILTLFVLIFTFPGVFPVITRGLDASYVLAINHLAAKHFDQFKELIYPFGPLGFLKYPLPIGSNLEVGIIWLIFTRLLFIGMIFYIGHLIEKPVLMVRAGPCSY